MRQTRLSLFSKVLLTKKNNSLFCISYAGLLVDQTGDYRAAFYFSGVCLMSSAVFVALVDRLVQRRKDAEAEVHQAIREKD